jgi:hypothetical protein
MLFGVIAKVVMWDPTCRRRRRLWLIDGCKFELLHCAVQKVSHSLKGCSKALPDRLTWGWEAICGTQLLNWQEDSLAVDAFSSRREAKTGCTHKMKWLKSCLGDVGAEGDLSQREGIHVLAWSKIQHIDCKLS